MPSSVDSNEDDFDGRFDDLHRLIGDYGSAVAVSADLAAKGRAGANDCYALEKQARISLKSALLARLHPAGEAVACWVSRDALDNLLRDGSHVGVQTIIWNTPDSKSGKVRVALFDHPAPTAADTPTYSNPDEETQMRLAEEQQMYADTAAAADTSGLVERAVAEAEEDGARMLNAERNAHIETSRHAVALAFGLRASEQQLAAAREQIAALEWERDSKAALVECYSEEQAIVRGQLKAAEASLSSAHETIRATLDAIEEIPEYNTSDYEKIRLILAAIKRTRAALTLAKEIPDGQ